VKVFAIFVLVLTGLVPTHADTTQTWNLTASCTETLGGLPCVDPAIINATFTTQMVFGTYVDPSGTGLPQQEIEPLIETLTGTFDGQAMTLTTVSSAGPWMDTFVSFPQMLYFMADGQTYVLFWDGSPEIQSQSNPNPNEILTGSAVDVPEPPLFWLLLTALSLLGLSRWAQTSLRKLSGR
jgi:hypothetical protein